MAKRKRELAGAYSNARIVLVVETKDMLNCCLHEKMIGVLQGVWK
jgi:hypothetical protein